MDAAAAFPTFDELEILRAAGERRADGGLFVDVGAHVGRYSAAMRAIGWEVLAFEPAPAVFRELSERIGTDPGVVLRQAAVAERAAEPTAFYVNDVHWGTSSLRPYLSTHGDPVMVDVVCLDDELRALATAAGRASIVKIDAEGADFAALRGLDVEVWRPDVVMVEFSDERTSESWSYTLADMVMYMGARGYDALVSEWAAVEEHARRGGTTAPFVHLGLLRWPVRRSIAWGNVFFVPSGEIDVFEQLAIDRLEAHGRERARHERELAARARAVDGVPPLKERIDELERAIQQRDQRTDELTRAIRDRDERIGEVQRSSAKWRARADLLSSEIQKRDDRAQDLRTAVARRSERITELDRAIEQRDFRIATLERAIQARDSRIGTVERAIQQRDSRIARLEEAVARSDARVAELEAPLGLRRRIESGMRRVVPQAVRRPASALRFRVRRTVDRVRR